MLTENARKETRALVAVNSCAVAGESRVVSSVCDIDATANTIGVATSSVRRASRTSLCTGAARWRQCGR